MRTFFLKVFGKRVFAGYGVVSLLSVAILAALYLTTRYGIHAYVSDQLERIPWDIAIVQRGEAHRYEELQRRYRAISGVRAVESIGFIRIRNMAPLRLEVGGRPLPIRWLGFIATSKPALVFPGLRTSDASAVSGSGMAVEVAFIGGQSGVAATAVPQIGGGAGLRLAYVAPGHADGEEVDAHSHGLPENAPGRTLFEASIAGSPRQIERQQFNKWMLRDVGSLTYLPEEALIVAVSMDQFSELSRTFNSLFLTSEGIHGGEAPPPYVPEVSHLIALDRNSWVSAWDLSGSLNRVGPLVDDVFGAAQWLTPFSYARSDLFLMLSHMNNVARLVGLVTLLIAIPLLWLSWVLARMLSGLMLLNERRLIGLALIRGIPMGAIRAALLTALILGGLGGAVLGLLLGAGVPILGYWIGGEGVPPASVLLTGAAYFAIFASMGVIMALLAGRGILQYVANLTPREAMARVAGGEGEGTAFRLAWYQIVGFLAALLVGTYKILGWATGSSPLVAVVNSTGYELAPNVAAGVFVVESVLNFVAVPLFLFGLAGLLMWRVNWVQNGLSAVTTPFVGSIHWYVGQHMALRRHRIVNLLFVAALAMSLSLLPQIAADSFYGRVVRGIRASVGGAILLDFDMAQLSGGGAGTHSVAEFQRRIEAHSNTIRRTVAADDRVSSVAVVQQFILPDVYIPSQSGLILNVVENPGEYLRTIYHEQTLGRTRPFEQIIRALDEQKVSVTQGLLRLRQIPLGRDIVLGSADDGSPVALRFDEVMAFLPGQPAVGIQQREGFVTAEIDYLNYVLGSDARIIAGSGPGGLPRLADIRVLPSRVVFIIQTRNGSADEQLAASLVKGLPLQPEDVRWEALETTRVSKDMFIALALENMKVYMFGGLLLALASVVAIGLVNFIADHRTFALLRLRGLPPGLLLRISVAIFLTPVIGGVLVGIGLGAVSGYGVSQAIWDLPRVYGVAAFLNNRMVVSPATWTIVMGFSGILAAISLGFGLWPFRHTAREAIRER